MERNSAFSIPLRPCNFSPTQSTTNLNLYTFCTLPHGILYSALHGSTEHYPTLELLRDALSNQSGIKIRLTNFFDVDMNRHAHLLANLCAQLFDIFTLFTDHYSRTRRMNSDTSGVRWALNINATDRGVSQGSTNVVSYFEIGQELVSVLLFARVPCRSMLF